ncbi:competence protein CoiA [Lactococcus hodotermopsidis]|uniref:Competence protein CoiA n=1 Tax=Pseudolactococcus hodotermopsidis TaxID=2709157 RepID=A0A6A0B8K0_9LACT|nr:competence protein CoiA family protein [Lactococcus hodotermopsidis]GFH41730.1 competence protein CoiA [Lactococcus hodotermopsidis]
MLVALGETNEIVNLLEIKKSDLAELSKQYLRCPACKSQVRLKNGAVKMPHFAHISLQVCQHFSENESFQHLTLKKRLYQWFKQTERVVVEQFLPDLQQTPDLLINNQIAIEIQCSHLTTQRLRERTDNYRVHGYTVLWLMGKDLWLGESLSTLKKNLLYFSQNAGFYYWELDLKYEKIRLKYLIHEELTGKLQYLTREFDFGSENLLQILRTPFDKTSAKLAIKIQQNIPKFIARQLYYQNPKWLKIQEKYYRNGRNLLTIANFPITIAPVGLKMLTCQFEALSSDDFCQITADLTSYYHHFLNYKNNKMVYPPAFYAKIESEKGAKNGKKT